MNQRLDRFPVRAIAAAVATAVIGSAAGLTWQSIVLAGLVAGAAVFVIEMIVTPRNAALGNLAMLGLVVAAWALVLVN
jgi:hypothetical protein